MLVRNRRTMRNDIDAYVALSDFVRQRFVEAGFPKERIFVKPNFEFYRKPREVSDAPTHALYLGRLTEEKGIPTLLRAWRDIATPLVLAGDGPMRGFVQENCNRPELRHAQYVGFLSREDTWKQMERAHFVVVPSAWQEPFGRAVIEAYAMGKPVLASRAGALSELISEGETGSLFEINNVADLVQKARGLLANPSRTRLMGVRARKRYEELYSPEANYRRMMEIYSQVMGDRVARQGSFL